ncbi:hypothetical protein Tco_1548830 [Tanacetum coccineum]
MKLSMKKLDFEDKYQVYGRIVGIKSLLEVTAAKVRVTAAKQNLEVSKNKNYHGEQYYHEEQYYHGERNYRREQYYHGEQYYHIFKLNRTRSLYQKIYWESLPEDILGVITRRHTVSHYLKTHWESLPEDTLGVITQRHTGSHYPKTYWESLPEDILPGDVGSLRDELAKLKLAKEVLFCPCGTVHGHQDNSSGGDVVDLTVDDEDRDTKMGDSTGVSVSLSGGISLEGKKSQESNIGGSDNTRDIGKTAGRAIIAWGDGIASYACITFIYGSLIASEIKRYLVKLSEESGEMFPGKAGKIFL